MYYLRTKANFDSAHFLKDYEGKCSNIHGHRWKVIAQVKKEELVSGGPKKGMVIDFGDLKDALNRLCDDMDHSLIYENGTLKSTTIEAMKDEGFRLIEVSFRPTAENFSKYFYDKLKAENIPVNRVEVYETPDNYAAYEE